AVQQARCAPLEPHDGVPDGDRDAPFAVVRGAAADVVADKRGIGSQGPLQVGGDARVVPRLGAREAQPVPDAEAGRLGGEARHDTARRDAPERAFERDYAVVELDADAVRRADPGVAREGGAYG